MELNRNNVRTLLGMIAFAAVLTAMLLHLGEVVGALRVAFAAVSFIFIGLSLAFIMNAPMCALERLLGRLEGSGRLGGFVCQYRRIISLLLTAMLALGLVLLVVFMVIPEFSRSIALLAEQIPAFLTEMNALIQSVADDPTGLLAQSGMPSIDWVKVGDTMLTFARDSIGNFVKGTFSAASSVVSGVVNVAVGFVLALYLLIQKERLIGQLKRFLYAFCKEKLVDKMTDIARLTGETFSSFVAGQFLEAIILGLLCLVGMSVLGFPFAPMISVLVAVTALIPVFGAFIGLFVGAFMILVNQGFLQAGWFILFFFILQQLENSLIYPHIVGRSVMLPGVWVMVAVTLGGKVAGVFGLLVSAPLCSVLYAIVREVVNMRNKRRDAPAAVQKE